MKVNIISKKYDKHVVLKNINMQFATNKITCISGPSGCGKSTLLRIIKGIDKDYDGFVTPFLKIGYVSQEVKLIEKYTILENILIGIEEYEVVKITEIARVLKLDKLLNTKCNKLSGGERQRVTILRSIISENDFILLDEPTSSLDKENGIQLLSLLKEVVHLSNVSIIMSSHEEYVLDFSDVNYVYKDNNFELTSSDFINPNEEYQDIKIKLSPIKSILNKYYKRYFLKNFMFLFVSTFLMILTVLSLLFFKGFLENEYDLYYDSIDNDKIAIKKKENILVCEKSCKNKRNFENLTFSQSEIEEINNMKNVDEVYMSGIELHENLDNEGNALEGISVDNSFFDQDELQYLIDINKNILTKTQDIKKIRTEGQRVLYSFKGVNIQPENIETYGYESKYHLLGEIILGTNKFSSNEQIVIPKNLAIFYSQQLNIPIEELLNLKIELNIKNRKLREKKSKEYEIIGIYDEKNAKDSLEIGQIFVQINIDTSSEYLYEELKKKYINDKKFQELYPDEETFLEKNETGVNTIIIKSNDIKSIEKELLNKYDAELLYSKNLYKKNNFVKLKMKSFVLILIVFISEIIVYLVLTRVLKKLYLNSVKNDTEVFEIIGYEKKEIENLYKRINTFDFIISISIFTIIMLFMKLNILIIVISIFIFLFTKVINYSNH